MDATSGPDLYRENLWLRQLLRTVAEDLERVALQESYGPHVSDLSCSGKPTGRSGNCSGHAQGNPDPG